VWTKPRWCPDLAAEVEAHARLNVKPQHLAPQVLGLLQDLPRTLAQEPAMFAFAQAVLAEARDAVPYARRPVAAYGTARGQVGRQRGLVPDAAPLDALCDRWHCFQVSAMTVAIWVVRRYLRIHARRHGPDLSPWPASFSVGHVVVVRAMEKTLLGGLPPDRGRVQPWRRGHA